jgi:DMATS type aromatic prenyltransferase
MVVEVEPSPPPLEAVKQAEQGMTEQGNSPQPYHVLSRYMDFKSRDEEFWWTHTGSLLAKFLQWAKYDIHQQYQFLQFFYNHIIAAIGPYRPFAHPERIWNSSVTPSGLPVEFSINYQEKGNAKPVLRIGCEPISHFSGSGRDRYNHYKVWETVNKLTVLPGMETFDPCLFRHFAEDLCTTRKEEEILDREVVETAHVFNTQQALGFDLKGDQVVVKAYIVPNMKSKSTGIPISKLLYDSITGIYGNAIPCSTLSMIVEYMESTGAFNDATWFSWDCIEPTKSRVKIYGSKFDSTWRKSEEIWTCGGQWTDPITMKGLSYLKELWDLLKIEEVQASPTFFRPPLVWTYELHPGDKTPIPRIYIPAHTESDLKIAQGLTAFFERLGWTDLAETYTKTLFSL